MDTGIIPLISAALHSASTSRTDGQGVAEPRHPSRSLLRASEVASRKDENNAATFRSHFNVPELAADLIARGTNVRVMSGFSD